MFLVYLLTGLLAQSLVSADAAAAPVAARSDLALPNWTALVYEQRGLWASARSTLSLDACSDHPTRWCASIENRVGNNFEVISLVMESDGTLVERQRYSQGRDRRKKTWTYASSQVNRQRLEPAGDDTWQLTSDRRLDYPDADQPPTDVHLLLLLAGLENGPPRIVHTDMNFYRVSFLAAGEDTLEIDKGLDLNGDRQREARLVTLRAAPVGTALDKPDFALLGLTGDITIAYDDLTGLPLQIRGRAPRLGEVNIDLKRAELRTPAP